MNNWFLWIHKKGQSSHIVWQPKGLTFDTLLFYVAMPTVVLLQPHAAVGYPTGMPQMMPPEMMQGPPGMMMGPMGPVLSPSYGGPMNFQPNAASPLKPREKTILKIIDPEQEVVHPLGPHQFLLLLQAFCQSTLVKDWKGKPLCARQCEPSPKVDTASQ